MGQRQYVPGLGRFLEVDPVEGGSANDYDYCDGDPVGCVDLDGRYSYKYSYQIGFARVAADALWAKAKSRFNKQVFPFHNSCYPLSVGKKCSLAGAPVRVAELGSRHFAFLSRPGHPEGANKYINFTIEQRGRDLYLVVTASGRDNSWQQIPGAKRGNRLFAHGMWRLFRENLYELLRGM